MLDQSDEWRRALEVLANSPEGATEALLFAHGFMYETITGLVDSGLAISTTEPFLADGRIVEVMRFRTTDAGRKALLNRGTSDAGPYQSPMEDGMQHFHEWYRSKIDV